jgi:hypothetical protein
MVALGMVVLGMVVLGTVGVPFAIHPRIFKNGFTLFKKSAGGVCKNAPIVQYILYCTDTLLGS